jgi:zinc/manganese transport system ATP-binding protein
LLPPLSGRVVINGVDVTGDPEKAGPYVGYVPQLFGLEQFKYPVTAWELVESSYLMHKGRWPRLFSSSSIRERVKQALRTVGLEEEAWRKCV